MSRYQAQFVAGEKLGTYANTKAMNRLRELPKASGLTVRQVAERTGMSFGYVAKVERGDGRLNEDSARNFAAALNVPVEFLLSEPEGDEMLDRHISVIRSMPRDQREIVYNFAVMLAKAKPN